MWERTLQDLIRGLRATTGKSQAQLDAFLVEAIGEIRTELRGGDMDLKGGAVLKMVYLMMLYPVTPPPSFAFHVVEVMSSPKYHLKEVGYLAAEGAFPEGTEEVVLTVNGIKKDLLSPSVVLPQLALVCLSSIVNGPLARDLSHDVSSLLTHSKPQVRKRAVLCMYKIFEKYPEALKDNFGRLRERLEDTDIGVVSATVNVLTELARKNPKNYLPLAPQLFAILSSSTNNWMLIKIVKCFALLTPHEPRLIRKLLPPITNLITTTSAVSLLYECVRTCITGGMLDDSDAGEALARVCIGKLSAFLEDEDQNLKYIALLAMVEIIPTHPHLLEDYQDEILKSVDDADLSIRLRALDLVGAMVTRRNIQPIVDQLLSALVPSPEASSLPSAAEALLSSLSGTSQPSRGSLEVSTSPTLLTPSYRLELTNRILSIGAHDTYSSVTSFDWYLSVLVDLTYVSRVDAGAEIRRQIADIVGRVRGVQRKAVELMSALLADDDFLEGAGSISPTDGQEGWADIVAAAAWVCGEYSEWLSSPPQIALLLLSPPIARLPGSIQAICVHAAAKVFGRWAAQKADHWDPDESAGDLLEIQRIVEKVVPALEVFRFSRDGEVQERAVGILHLFSFIQADLKAYKPTSRPATPQPSFGSPSAVVSAGEEETNPFASDEAPPPSSSDLTPKTTSTPHHPKSLLLLHPLFSAHALPPVSSRAQASIAVPTGLDLDTPLYTWSDDGGGSLQIGASSSGSGSDSDAPVDRAIVKLKNGGGRFRTAEEEELRRVVAAGGRGGKKKTKGKGKESAEEAEERRRRKAARLARQKDNPYYIGDNKGADSDDVDSISIVKLDLSDAGNGSGASSHLPHTSSSTPRLRSQRTTKSTTTGKRSGGSARSQTPPPPTEFVPEIDREGVMPEGVTVVIAPASSLPPVNRRKAGGGKTSKTTKKKTGTIAVDVDNEEPSLANVQLDFGLGAGGRSGATESSSRTSSIRVGGSGLRGGRYEEYEDGDVDMPRTRTPVDGSGSGAMSPIPPAPTPAPTPVAAEADVEVVRVVKKTKKKKATVPDEGGGLPGEEKKAKKKKAKTPAAEIS